MLLGYQSSISDTWMDSSILISVLFPYPVQPPGWFQTERQSTKEMDQINSALHTAFTTNRQGDFLINYRLTRILLSGTKIHKQPTPPCIQTQTFFPFCPRPPHKAGPECTVSIEARTSSFYFILHSILQLASFLPSAWSRLLAEDPSAVHPSSIGPNSLLSWPSVCWTNCSASCLYFSSLLLFVVIDQGGSWIWASVPFSDAYASFLEVQRGLTRTPGQSLTWI